MRKEKQCLIGGNEMEQKKYLGFWKKVAYGSGDMASNFCYTFVSSFTLIYLTDAVGLSAGIIGTLMMVSRIFDGISDVIAGNVIDRTHHKWGKARPWMLWTIIPVAVCQILMFSVPSMNETLQYAYFFVVYTLLNAVFYTLNNIAYATLSVFITTNKEERVQLGVFRFIFTCIAGVLISGGTMALVDAFGGGTPGWRMTAIIFAVCYAVISFICAWVCKELPESELGITSNDNSVEEKLSLLQTIKYLLRNPFFIEQLTANTLYNLLMSATGVVGVYYMTYVLGNASLLGIFALIQLIPMIIGLMLTPMLVKRFGIYKTNLLGFGLATAFCVPFLIFGMKGMVVPMMISHGIAWLGRGPQVGNGQALTAEISGYTLRKDGVHVEAAMFSCSSMGIKVGAGLGTALTGWLLEVAHYDGTAAAQPESAVYMISFMYVALPLIISVIVLGILALQKVEKANQEWDLKHGKK